ALGRHNRHGARRLKGEGGPGRDTRSPEERLSLNNVTQPCCTWPPLATTRSVCGTAPRGSLGLIGELLPTNGGFHHHPTDGVPPHRHAVDEVGVGGDSRLHHHRRGVRRQAELA